ncbi:hypothetical protein PIB30_044345 [Stylosanthes scabra]|uniref:Uncharacterized protein n=1 Tax=Stylosanthes scabra TaxID=79078 RepID=A0ABU6RGC0_9FABA|nr:hypothetical protein [Stylosanthes scabra]
MEAVKRAEELAKKQQAILDEAEKREKDRQEKLSSRALTLVDNGNKTLESKDHTWKPPTVVTKAPEKEKSKHPFSSHILVEQLPKTFWKNGERKLEEQETEIWSILDRAPCLGVELNS